MTVRVSAFYFNSSYYNIEGAEVWNLQDNFLAGYRVQSKVFSILQNFLVYIELDITNYLY